MFNQKKINIKLKNVMLLFFLISFACCDLSFFDTGVNIYGYNGNHKLIKIPVPEGGITFPIGFYDDDTAFVSKAFYIGETEVTMSMYFTVAKWAQENRGYKNLIINFDELRNNPVNPPVIVNYPEYARNYAYNSINTNSGSLKGNFPINGIPFTGIIVWCNAYTEWYNNKYKTNYEPVYTDNNGDPIKNALIPYLPYSPSLNFTPLPCITNWFDPAYETLHKYLNEDNGFEKYLYNVSTTGNGFRLPTANEWELAARWNGSNPENTVNKTINNIDFSSQSIKFIKGNSASGAKTYIFDEDELSKVAVFLFNSRDGKAFITDPTPDGYYHSLRPIKTKRKNALGLYDMSGSVREIVYNVVFIEINRLDIWGRRTGEKVLWPFAQSRGGSFRDADDTLSVGHWQYVDATAYNDFYGFRIARCSY